MTYVVTYQETNVVRRDIEANSEDEAEEIFQEMIAEGKIDFTFAEPVDSGIYIKRKDDLK